MLKSATKSLTTFKCGKGKIRMAPLISLCDFMQDSVFIPSTVLGSRAFSVGDEFNAQVILNDPAKQEKAKYKCLKLMSATQSKKLLDSLVPLLFRVANSTTTRADAETLRKFFIDRGVTELETINLKEGNK